MLNFLVNLARYDSWQGKLLRLPLNLLPKKTPVRIISGKSRGKKWIVGSTDHGAWLGTYESVKQDTFVRFVRKNMIVYDIGAHVGIYTLLSSILVGNKGHVIAFEPLPENLNYLYKHINLNDLSNVRVIEAAISDMTGFFNFSIGSSSTTGQLNETGDLIVQTFTLDEVVLRDKLPLPDVIKIDIEGAEAKALRGAVDILTKSSPVIFLATHGETVCEECRTLLASYGYSMTPLEGDKTDSEFVVERVDVYGDMNCLER